MLTFYPTRKKCFSSNAFPEICAVARLPVEIRLMIGKEVLGGHWLHVVRAYGRLEK
jgi:hypothetical protein